MSGTVWAMYRAMVGTGVLCGALIVSAFTLTRERITENQTAALEQAVRRVLPGGVHRRAFVWQEPGRFRPVTQIGSEVPSVHAMFTSDDKLAGVAVRASATGYQDTIEILYGYAPGAEAIVGFSVLSSRETPGLGDRIESDPDFLRDFERLDVRLSHDGSQLVHPISLVPAGKKSEPWQVDAISGATVSSEAVVRALRESTALWVPRITARKEDFLP